MICDSVLLWVVIVEPAAVAKGLQSQSFPRVSAGEVSEETL